MSALLNGAAWINGEILPISEAKIGVTDWGLTHSDITYDVVSVWDGAFFRLEDHLDRFQQSLQKTRLAPPQSRDDIRQILHEMVRASGLHRAYCAFVASRGTPSIPGSRDPRHCANHFYAWVVPYVHVIPKEVVARGARLKIATVSRRIAPDSVDPTAKNYHWGDMTAAIFEAVDDGYDTVVLADHNGNMTEGPGFNLFAVIDGCVVTPKTGVLMGITRKTVLDICAAQGICCDVRDLPVAEFLRADEVFVTSSGGGALPITRVNQTILNNDACGPLTSIIRQSYFDWRSDPKYQSLIDYD